MAPRAFTLPKATTASAKAARAAFFCELCQKGYSRMNEFEAHESSYDHQHKKRLKEMKEMQRQVHHQSANKKEEKGLLMSIKLGSSSQGVSTSASTSTGGAGFKKGGFKNAFAAVEGGEDGKGDDVAGDEETHPKQETNPSSSASASQKVLSKQEDLDSDVTTDDEDYYDPHKPTGCTPTCKGRQAVDIS